MTIRGEKLFDLLVELSGLEKDAAESELSGLITELGIDRNNMTTEDIRHLMSIYLGRTIAIATGDSDLAIAPLATELEMGESSLLESNPVAKA